MLRHLVPMPVLAPPVPVAAILLAWPPRPAGGATLGARFADGAAADATIIALAAPGLVVVAGHPGTVRRLRAAGALRITTGPARAGCLR